MKEKRKGSETEKMKVRNKQRKQSTKKEKKKLQINLQCLSNFKDSKVWVVPIASVNNSEG